MFKVRPLPPTPKDVMVKLLSPFAQGQYGVILGPASRSHPPLAASISIAPAAFNSRSVEVRGSSSSFQPPRTIQEKPGTCQAPATLFQRDGRTVRRPASPSDKSSFNCSSSLSHSVFSPWFFNFYPGRILLDRSAPPVGALSDTSPIWDGSYSTTILFHR